MEYEFRQDIFIDHKICFYQLVTPAYCCRQRTLKLYVKYVIQQSMRDFNVRLRQEPVIFQIPSSFSYNTNRFKNWRCVQSQFCANCLVGNENIGITYTSALYPEAKGYKIERPIFIILVMYLTRPSPTITAIVC